MLDPHHILLRNTFRNAHNQGNLRVDCFINGSSSKRRRDIDDRSRCSCFLFGFLHSIKDGQAQVLLATLPWSGSSHEFGAVLQSLLTVKGTLFACETLANNLRIFINIDMFPRGCVRPVSYPILLQEEGARQQAGGGEAAAAGDLSP